MYDFHKARTKEAQKEFKHDYFKRSKPELLKFIKRKLGEENSNSGPKPDILFQKCKELEDKCQTFESIAKLSIPVKRLKTISSEKSNKLLEGLIGYLDEDCKDKSYQSLINQATEEYIQKLREITGAKCPTLPAKEDKKEAFQCPNCCKEPEHYLSKRQAYTEETVSPFELSEDLMATVAEEQSTCNSMESLEFNMDLLDFDQCPSKPLDSMPHFSAY